MTTTILFFGDVVGRAAREAITRHIPRLRKEYGADAVIVDGDNAASGFGITPDICTTWLENGVDVVTGGDHIWDQKDIIPYIAKEKRLLRPYNLPTNSPGQGFGIFTLQNGKKMAVLHLMGQVFMKNPPDCPFAGAQKALSEVILGGNVDAIFVDFHAEATSEKNAMGHFLNGKVSAVIGSHTHVPTADACILPGGTAYQTDAGMCGDYHSVIGFDIAAPLERFTQKMTKNRLQPANKEAELCGTRVTLDAKGRATEIEILRIKG